MLLIKSGFSLSDVRDMTLDELDGWMDACRLFADLERVQKIEDAPFHSMQFKNAGKLWKSATNGIIKQVQVATGTYHAQQPKPSNKSKVVVVKREKGGG